MQLILTLLAILALNGAAILGLSVLARTELIRRYRVRADRPFRIEPAVRIRTSILNSIVSVGLLFGVVLAFRLFLIRNEPVSLLRTIGEAVGILAMYDFGYYLLHRFVFHEWSVGRRVHAVHHTIRTPYAVDSLYIHPAETVGGVGLLLLCTAILGPVGESSFELAFLVYSLLNVFIHSAIDLRFFPFRTLTALVRHHDAHHQSMKAGYYASITPLWDLVFGTARTPHSPGHSPGHAPGPSPGH